MTTEQINLMIESLEELNEELSDQSKGTLLSEQWDLLEHLKQTVNDCCHVWEITTGICVECGKSKYY